MNDSDPLSPEVLFSFMLEIVSLQTIECSSLEMLISSTILSTANLRVSQPHLVNTGQTEFQAILAQNT